MAHQPIPSEETEDFPAFTGRLARLHPLLLTALAITAAALMRWLLDGLLGAEVLFLTFLPAILLVTLVAGWGYGLLATAASGAASVLFLIGISGRGREAAVALAYFVTVNALVILLGEGVRRAKASATGELLAAQAREVALAQEIEARRAAEAALRESEGRFRAIFEHTPVGICEEDFTAVRAFIDELRAQGVREFAEYFDAHPEAVRRGAECVRVLDVNAATLELFGAHSKQELLGAITQIFMPETFEVLKAELVAIAKGHDMFFAETPVRKLTGERLETIFSIVFPRTEAGSALVTHIDITERRRAEERFRLIVEAAPYAVLLVDEDRKIRLMNSQSEELFGYERTELLGQPLDRLIPERFRQAHRGYCVDFQGAPSMRPMGAGRDLFALRKDGAEVPIEISLSPVETSEGRCVMAAIVDIRERKAAEAELAALARERESLLEAERAARGEAESANRLKDEFLATLSHELRTPLANIVSWARVLLRKEVGENERLRQGLTLIGENAMMQSHMIGELLDMGRIAAGKVTLEVSPLDLGELISQCVANHQATAKEKGIDLALKRAGVPKIVLADAARLQQVFGNLLSNAFKFTPRGGRVIVNTAPAEGGFEVTVEDTGEGIAPEALPHIFERFRQADSSTSRRHGGLGLGLALVKQLVELHGGRVAAASEGAGQGARFRVFLPAAEALDSRGVEGLSDSGRFRVANEPLEPESLSGLAVLVVEDDPSMLELTRRVLVEHGAGVTACASAAEALARLRSNPDEAQVLVSDLGMPGMDGFTFLRSVRAELGLTPERLPALAISAYTRPEDRERALAAGFQRYLTKPWEAVQLVAAVRELGNGTGPLSR